MALTITQVELSAAIRLGDSAEEVAEATRLLGYVIEAISRHLGDAYEAAPEAVVNEAAIRLAGYLFDQPNAGRGLSFANAGRNSGAWTMLLPYRIHRAGTTGEAVAAAQAAIGSTGNPVTNVSVDAVAATITVTFTDGTTRTDNLPAGMGGGADQTARDAAAAAQADVDAHEATPHNLDTLARSNAVDARHVGEAAQATADAVRTELTTHETTPHGGGAGADQMARDAAASAQAEIDAHEATPHNTDTTARSVAQNARTTAERVQADLATHEGSTHNHNQIARDAAATARDAAATAQGAIDAHEAAPHNTDATARTAAADAQSAIDDHERAPHNTDGAARTAASAAQARADDAFALADGKVDPAGAAAAAREVTVDWAEAENPDPIPAPKLINVIEAHEDIVNVLDGRLPGLPVPMRLGWSQRADFIAADFARPSPPIGGSIAGMSDGLAVPPFPPGLASDPTLFLGIWLAGDPDVVEIAGGGTQFGDARPLTLEGGKVGGTPGVYLVSNARLRPLEGTIFSVTITGPRIVTESDLAAHAGDPDAHHIPPTGQGGGPVVLYESTAAIGTATGLIAGNVACPETGDLEFYFEGLTGTRQGGIAYARIPTARIRGAVSALNIAYSNNSATLLAIPHGANRGVGIAVQATTSFLLLSAQAPGDFYIRIAHTV